MRVLECQLSANFLVFSQPAVNHNKNFVFPQFDIMDKIQFLF